MNNLKLSGIKFGRLTALNVDGYDNQGLIKWKCLCDCGNFISVSGPALKKGNTKSCGCIKKEKIAIVGKSNVTHGHTRRSDKGWTDIYAVWRSMKARCLNKNQKSYMYYGGRGIKICDRWANSFENFLNDMGDKPLGMTIERKDGNGDYCPENCVWATVTEQNRNKSDSRKLTYKNEVMTIAEWTRKLGLKSHQVYDWINSGSTLEKLIDKIGGCPK
jgi:hypothetical protein